MYDGSRYGKFIIKEPYCLNEDRNKDHVSLFENYEQNSIKLSLM